jgi:type I restriction enzyme S subunit
MELRAGYKKTEIGVIPEDWEVKKLGEITKLKNGYAFSSDFFSDSGPIVITPGNFKLEGGLTFSDRNTLRYSGNITKEMQFKNGDLLIVMTDLTPNCNLLGKPGIVNSEEVILHNQRIGKISLTSKLVNQDYLYWFFVSELFSKRMKETATGSTVRHTSVGSINDTILAIPTLVEQTAIANALSDIDSLINSLEKLIAKKRNIKQAAMQKLLKPKESWKIKKLGEIADGAQKWSFTGGPFGSNLKSSDYTDEGIRVIQLQNIGDGHFINHSEIYTSEVKADELLSCNIYPGDIILSKMGDPVARACIIPNNHSRYLMCSDGIRLAVNQKDNNTLFIYSYINSPAFRIQAENNSTGSTRKRIGLVTLRNLQLIVPDFEEQTRIALILSDMDEEINALDNKLEKYRNVKLGMMQNLLTGKIRLA